VLLPLAEAKDGGFRGIIGGAFRTPEDVPFELTDCIELTEALRTGALEFIAGPTDGLEIGTGLRTEASRDGSGGAACALVAGFRALGPDIQSGWLLGVHGLDGRSGLGSMPLPGGCSVERAGIPLSSHHLRLSELAGGRPGSIESYPRRSSSSSLSSFWAFAVAPATAIFLLS